MHKERIAELEKEISQLERELVDNDQIIGSMMSRRKKIETRLSNLHNSLEQIKPRELIVSDHALVRYAERHLKLPVEQIRKEIAEQLKGADSLTNLKYAGFVIRNKTVVTYVPREGDSE